MLVLPNNGDLCQMSPCHNSRLSSEYIPGPKYICLRNCSFESIRNKMLFKGNIKAWRKDFDVEGVL